jgi:DNA-binding NarL/FixJ family response regulator
MSESNNVVDIRERDQQILQLRLSGVSIPQIAKRYRLTDKAVVRAIDKLLPTLDVATRARYLKETLLPRLTGSGTWEIERVVFYRQRNRVSIQGFDES